MQLKKDREAFSPQNMLDFRAFPAARVFFYDFEEIWGDGGRRTEGIEGRDWGATNALVGRVGGRYWRVLCGT